MPLSFGGVGRPAPSENTGLTQRRQDAKEIEIGSTPCARVESRTAVGRRISGGEHTPAAFRFLPIAATRLAGLTHLDAFCRDHS